MGRPLAAVPGTRVVSRVVAKMATAGIVAALDLLHAPLCSKQPIGALRSPPGSPVRLPQAPWRSGKMPAFESAPLIQKSLSTVSECSCRTPRPAQAHWLRCAPSDARCWPRPAPLHRVLHPWPRPAPCTVHRAPCTAHRAPCTVHRAPCTAHRAQCTAHRAPCTAHRAPCTAHRAGRVKQGSLTNEDVLRSEIPWPSFQNAGIISKEQLEMVYLLDKQEGSAWG